MTDSSPSVLIVDDDPGLAGLMSRQLGREGYRGIVAGSGREALAWMGENRADLLLLDYSLPDMNAEELVGALREGGRGTPFIVITGRGDERVAVRMMKQGALDYLMKDGALLDLLPSVVGQAWSRVQGERRLAEAECRLRQMYAQVEKNRDDLLSVLDSLRVGALIVDEGGRLEFVNRNGEALLSLDRGRVLGQGWAEVCPFADKDKWRLMEIAQLPPERREKVSVGAPAPGGGERRVEIEVKDDPYHPRRRIFFLYDVSEVHELRLMLDKKTRFNDLVGKSEEMRQVIERLQEVAGVDATVLIEGETGTGKEMVARAIHFSGHRREGPFVAVNCAGLTDSLLESQLFGHKRGAFTGAVQDHQGFFEAAGGGTLFLDEIGDIPASVQTRLLRVLQEREIMRVGESRPRKVDVRVVAATQHDLEEEVAEGRFRRDLFYRIRVARIPLPPLRERREDIPLLAGLFLRRFGTMTGKGVTDFANDALRALMDHDWPGNVRELQNAVEAALIRCKGSVILPGDLPPEVARARPPSSAPAEAPGGALDERGRILAALRDAGGNRSRAAQLLGVSRATLYRRLAEMNLSRKGG